MLVISFAVSIVVFLILGMWKTGMGVFRRHTSVLYPADRMADLMSELAQHKEFLGNEMEKKIQDAEMKRIQALTESAKKAQEVTKKTNQMKRLEEERNHAREDAQQRRRDIDWLFSKRNVAQASSLAPELRWPSFPEIAASSSTQMGPKALAEPTTLSVRNTSTAAAQGVSSEMPTPSSPPPGPNLAGSADLRNPGGSPSTNTNHPKLPAASITRHKDPSKKPIKGNLFPKAPKGPSIPPPQVPPGGPRNSTSAPMPKDSATRTNSKQTPGPGKGL